MASAPVPAQPPLPQVPQATDPLAALRDIHEPAMIATWPPAPGWWFLAAVAVLLLLAAFTWMYLQWRADRYRREASRELNVLINRWQEDRDDSSFLLALQALLKRVALTRFPREQVASLTGEAWLQFLDRSTGSHDFSMGAAEVLVDGNYREGVVIDVHALSRIAGTWISKHDPRHLAEAQIAEGLAHD